MGALFVALRSASEGTSLEAVLAPFDVALGSSVVQPDIVVTPRESGDARDLRTPPVLVVEVRSASTGWLDEGRKRTLYEEHGVAAYWLVDPNEPSIVALELQDGCFVEVATAHGDHSVQLTSPFPITVNPAVLARG